MYAQHLSFRIIIPLRRLPGSSYPGNDLTASKEGAYFDHYALTRLVLYAERNR
jgi:hypothetical protein